MNYKSFKHILFDLDGTIIDSKDGITKSVAYALSHFGIKVKDLSELYTFIGPPLLDSFQKYYGFDSEKALLAVNKYRERYAKLGVYENTLYEGIPDLLTALNNMGYKLYLATSKPEHFAKEIIQFFNLTSLFSFIGGSGLDGSLHYKYEVIDYVLKTNQINPQEAVMVGDRCFDIEGAQQTNIAAIGVLYGYGTREEMEMCNCETILETVADLKKYFVEKQKFLQK